MGSNERHEKFVEEYVTNGWNGAQAARAAGYSPKTAEATVSRLLRNVKVKKVLKRDRPNFWKNIV